MSTFPTSSNQEEDVLDTPGPDLPDLEEEAEETPLLDIKTRFVDPATVVIFVSKPGGTTLP